jgi:HPt (histidine-containing phosphotransfer) domain-containing protein
MGDDERHIIDIPRTASMLGVSRQFYRRVLKKFIACRDEYLLPISEFALQKDYVELMKAAHRLKGAASYLRITVLMELAFEIEWLARQKQEADYQQLINRITSIIDGLGGPANKND